MPAVSFYLKKEVLDAVRARAGSGNIPVSRIISRAVEEYLKTGETVGARKRVMEHIRRGAVARGLGSAPPGKDRGRC